MNRYFVFTSGGITAESGIEPFRAANNPNEKYFSLTESDPYKKDTIEFFDKLRNDWKDLKPNAAHIALAELEKDIDGEILILTTNFDDLHEKAGSENVIHICGDLKHMCCEDGHRWELAENEEVTTKCPICGKKARFDIVLQGENPKVVDQWGELLEEITDMLERGQEFLVVGDSCLSLALSYTMAMKQKGVHTTSINIEELSDFYFADQMIEPASVAVPKWCSMIKEWWRGGSNPWEKNAEETIEEPVVEEKTAPKKKSTSTRKKAVPKTKG